MTTARRPTPITPPIPATPAAATPPAVKPMVASSTPTTPGPKLRQTQAEYTAARPNAEPGVKPMMSSSKMYVCIKCHANFKTGDGKPDPRLRGLGRCNNCLSQKQAQQAAA
jgi:cytochrome c553